jgi:hypothetical protein
LNIYNWQIIKENKEGKRREKQIMQDGECGREEIIKE